MVFFSKKLDYPELGAESPVAEQINEVEGPLKALMFQVSDPLEIFPPDDQSYVFIGTPPKKPSVAVIKGVDLQSFVAAAK